jgi:hypothetical protein
VQGILKRQERHKGGGTVQQYIEKINERKKERNEGGM